MLATTEASSLPPALWANLAAMHVTSRFCEGWRELDAAAREARWAEGLADFSAACALEGDASAVAEWFAAQGFAYGARVAEEACKPGQNPERDG